MRSPKRWSWPIEEDVEEEVDEVGAEEEEESEVEEDDGEAEEEDEEEESEDYGDGRVQQNYQHSGSGFCSIDEYEDEDDADEKLGI